MTEEETMLAGELALGLLDGADRAAALRLVIADPAFAREVEQWRHRFAALHVEWPEVDPGPAAQRRALGPIEPARATNRRWQWLAGMSSVAAAALLAVVLLRPAAAPTVIAPPATAATPSLVAVLKPDRGEPFGAVYDPTARQLRLTITMPVPAGRDAQLWAIGADGVPHAAGLLRTGGTVRLPLRHDLTIGAGSTLAISVEPVGGSPRPTPTGPVVATGKLVAV